jgi:hypothetical protein
MHYALAEAESELANRAEAITTRIGIQPKRQSRTCGARRFLVVHDTLSALIGIILIAGSSFPPIAAADEKPFAWRCLRKMIRNGSRRLDPPSAITFAAASEKIDDLPETLDRIDDRICS